MSSKLDRLILNFHRQKQRNLSMEDMKERLLSLESVRKMFITSSPNTVIQAKIRVYEMLGAEVYLHFDYEGATMTARVDSRTTARTGDTVTFAFDAEKIHVFDKETEKTITN